MYSFLPVDRLYYSFGVQTVLILSGLQSVLILSRLQTIHSFRSTDRIHSFRSTICINSFPSTECINSFRSTDRIHSLRSTPMTHFVHCICISPSHSSHVSCDCCNVSCFVTGLNECGWHHVKFPFVITLTRRR